MAYAIGYRIDGKHGSIVAMKCLDCGATTRVKSLIDKKTCAFCGKIHQEKMAAEFKLLNPSGLKGRPPRGDGSQRYTLYHSSNKKSNKQHYSINGKNALCLAKISQKVAEISIKQSKICVNCANLKKRGIAR